MSVEKIPHAEFVRRLKEQGVEREHSAFVCPVCGTVQSMASLAKAGVPDDKIELQIGYSCEGRWTDAGPWPRSPAAARASHRGCDWTLGGLFTIHRLEVEMEDKAHPVFDIASREQAEVLRADLAKAGAS